MSQPKNIVQKYPHLLVALLSAILLSIYWGMIATNRYVSEANVVLESPQLSAPSFNFQSLMGGGAGAGRADMLLLRDFLLSVDMLNSLQNSLNIREHYSQKHIDTFSRLGSADAPTEKLHRYIQRRISVELDDYAQVLRIRVEAFEPEMAQRITQLMLHEGEQHMNAMGKRLAEEQVRFLEEQVKHLETRLDQSIAELLQYQNVSGLVSPQGTVESLSVVIASLESQLSNLSARRSALLSFQSPRSPEVLRVDSEIKALNEQIRRERSRLAQTNGNALNVLTSEYQALELKVQFARDSYSAALMALENTRIEAARKLKQVSVLQAPTLPEFSTEPRRLYNIIVVALVTLFLALISHMLLLIIKDHRD